MDSKKTLLVSVFIILTIPFVILAHRATEIIVHLEQEMQQHSHV